jgi:hypothetical protein
MSVVRWATDSHKTVIRIAEKKTGTHRGQQNDQTKMASAQITDADLLKIIDAHQALLVLKDKAGEVCLVC